MVAVDYMAVGRKSAGRKPGRTTGRMAAGPYPFRDRRAWGIRICRRSYKPKESSSWGMSMS